MITQQSPDVFTLDVVSANDIPLRFMFWPRQGVVRYHDRRYTLQPEQPGYGINHTNENGQCAGGVMLPGDFSADAESGIRGWHEVDAWDVDAATCRLVGTWLAALTGGEQT